MEEKAGRPVRPEIASPLQNIIHTHPIWLDPDNKLMVVYIGRKQHPEQKFFKAAMQRCQKLTAFWEPLSPKTMSVS